MDYHGIHKIISVWIAYFTAWIVEIVFADMIGTIIILKEIFALIGFIIAAGYTAYKFKKEWTGWLPNKKDKNKKD